MLSLTAFSKANHANILPALLVATFINRNEPDDRISISMTGLEAVASDGYIQLKTPDESLIYDQAVFTYLQHHYVLHSTHKGQVVRWATFANDLAGLGFGSLNEPLTTLAHHLTLRSFILGYSITVADLVVWGAIYGNKALLASVRKYGGNVRRWFKFIEVTNPWIKQVVLDLETPARHKRAADNAAGGSYDIGLDADRVVTRFPPEPSGYLHIGHAKAALLNDHFAHRKDGGTMICRFDDTNPSKETAEFEESILKDLDLLGITPDKISHSSDYFQLTYELCIELISTGRAYADDTDREIVQDQRGRGIPSGCRDMPPVESLIHFDQMRSGSAHDMRWCIRAKISIDDVNKAMRDPVIYRCNLQAHHRTGTQWKIYPTYDFCAPILDSIEGVTYALRTNEYRDRNSQYTWFQKSLGLRQVKIWDFSRLNFVHTVLSKRKLALLIEKGAVSDWDDPRMPTLRGLRRRGLTIPALREFILKQGPSRNIVNMYWTSLWSINRKYIDPISPRYTVLLKKNIVTATIHGTGIENGDSDIHIQDKFKHTKNPSLGTKRVIYTKTIYIEQQDAQTLQPSQEITLINWENAITRNITTTHKPESQSPLISSLTIDLLHDPPTNPSDKSIKTIPWLPYHPDIPLTPVQLVDFDHILTKQKIENGDDISSYINWDSESGSECWADCDVEKLEEGDIIRVEGKGFFRVDRVYRGGDQAAILFAIPDGRMAY
ncbi:hypothetical protein FQN54_001814 [Arachnomyces sp. PD_36]|nr:hypothetical protein FQN54_001814 [Arachnomyces sp. PD_36]